MSRREYIREQIRKGRQLVTGDDGNTVRPEKDDPKKAAKIARHDWGF